ncbi:MAG: alpha-amylase family glycosyl hydrolase [Pseudomonadota bacterium]
MHYRLLIASACALIGLSACNADEDAASIDPAPSVDAPSPQRSAPEASAEPVDPFWRNASIYFLMTDRFANGDPDNDRAYGRQPDGDTLRSFMGGDIAGIIEKLEEGYFSDLGVTAIWTTPVIEQIRQPFQEFGRSYPFHGYWPRDWTAVDKAFGTEEEFARMIALAHEQGIRVLVDVIVNHAGPPLNDLDPRWPEDWVRGAPDCDWTSFAGVATCQIVPALQDIRTESEEPVDLPSHLLEKWKSEGRLDEELAELDAFFERTGYPRAPKYYIIKWQTDWVREYGVDGFRIDTAKHVEPEVWSILKAEAKHAFAEWKRSNPDKVLDDRDFYMMGEVFNYGVAGFQNAVAGTRAYDYGDIKVDFFDFGFDALINMGFATHAKLPAADLFQLYANEFDGAFKGVSVLNYISSHDDQAPLDPLREAPFANANKLLLAPGAVQIYYGDELNRSLVVEGAMGDATLRSFMNWEALDTDEGKAILAHWRALSNFRKDHLAVGAGVHVEHGWSPYVFSRSLNEDGVEDRVLIAMSDQPIASIKSFGVFSEGTRLRDAYRGDEAVVSDGRVTFSTPRTLMLLERVE